MGYVLAMGHCILCDQVFSFNPISVPSVRVDGTRRPVCETCIQTRVNPHREKLGLELVVPADDAYEAVDESVLGGD
jgi:hypothetical protein